MKTIALPQPTTTTDPENASGQAIEQFYNEATSDYSFWSKDFNMHFGYYRPFAINPLKRDQMLNEMNRQISLRLSLSNEPMLITDMGCGMGGTMRYMLKHYPRLSCIGVTLSGFQVAHGNRMLKDDKAVILKEDYCHTSIPTASQDGAVSIESFCHVGHSKKALKEAYRILKQGKKLVIADAFIKKSPKRMCWGSRNSYSGICKGWSLDGLGTINEVAATLAQIGFQHVRVEDISMRVAPSVLHVPFAIPGFIIKQLWQGKRIKKQSWNNLKASFFSLTAGLHRHAFGYYIITATK
ncbi:MAG: SAM-dependent methyltransferase [Cytophagaceae bacterium]|nr:SAM-dependent methyltransferase [Cytophagaceae bacterium]